MCLCRTSSLRDPSPSHSGTAARRSKQLAVESGVKAHEGDEDPASLVGRLSDTSWSMVVFTFLLGSRGIGLSQHCGRVSRTVRVDLFSCRANLSTSDDVSVSARMVGCNGGLVRSSIRRAPVRPVCVRHPRLHHHFFIALGLGAARAALVASPSHSSRGCREIEYSFKPTRVYLPALGELPQLLLFPNLRLVGLSSRFAMYSYF